MKKKFLNITAFILLISLFILCECKNSRTDRSKQTDTGNITAAGVQNDNQAQVSPTAANKAVSGDSTQNNTGEKDGTGSGNSVSVISEDNTDESSTAGDAAIAGSTGETAGDDKGQYNPDFELLLEAEDADTAGKVKSENTLKGFTGKGYLIGFEGPEDTVTFTVTVPGSGAYDLNFISASYSGHKENIVLVDGEAVGMAKVDGSEFTDSILENVYLKTGEHKITIKPSWGWIYLDSLKIKASKPADPAIYEVSAELVDKKATVRTKMLMQYLADTYGDYILSGQYCDKGFYGAEINNIKRTTGKYPAILGLDFIEYTPSRVAHGSSGKSVQYAVEYDKEGGIVTFCWHWNAPEPYLPNTTAQPWWSGFYVKATNINLKKIMDGKDKEGYDLLLRDIDAIAVQLKKLQDADIPVLWRPLHEASGGWFWWGASGPEAYIKLYRLLFDRLTNYHNIHNLIWIWNGQNKDWYPGDEYVDIVSTDIYPGERVYASQVSMFNELLDWTGDCKKIIALSENGCLFDPDLAFRDNARWAFFSTWGGEFSLTEKYTEKDMVNKVYNHEKVITLDELPDLKNYNK